MPRLTAIGEIQLGKFSEYKIPLKSLEAGTHHFEYVLDNSFFEKIDSPEVQRGKLVASVDVKKTGNSYELDFQIEGVIQVSCDRCLDDMDQNITHKSKLYVKFGKEFSEESNDIVIIPEDEGEINIAWFLFEFIVLSIPMKHIHMPGKCNKTMTTKLRKHTASSKDDEDGGNEPDAEFEEEEDVEGPSETDPRWDELKKIIDNN